jgi:hypothetical protein
MIKVTVVDPIDPAWVTWRSDAGAETILAAAAKGETSYSIKNDMYKRPRRFLLEAFADKCGYCETKIDAPERFGDVDHFRPKGRVTNDNHAIVLIPDGHGGNRKHPGYYWLVYEWSNFIPSCTACNRPGEDRDGLKSGKHDLFPLASPFRAVEPGDETKEEPLLLNPRVDDPNDHLVFDAATGIIGYKTPKGEATIRILGLNRRGLPEARMNAYDAALALWSEYENALTARDEPRLTKLDVQSDSIRRGSAPYAAFGRLGIAEARGKNEARQARLRRFLGQ